MGNYLYIIGGITVTVDTSSSYATYTPVVDITRFDLQNRTWSFVYPRGMETANPRAGATAGNTSS